ncbi:MAG: TetR family transcriptional regulator [Frankiales bacterium]|jgi:AcrR family transcriptional regulator|nr:TetR family transcriptional regulator [Frankiales bacterium]
MITERGRPRDPSLEQKVFDAALAVYRTKGWSGFTLDAVARGAGVGREALYRRWASKADLLGDAVQAHSPVLAPLDSGSTRDDLTALVRHFLASYRDPFGVVGLRMVLDAQEVPDLAKRFRTMVDGQRLRHVQAVVRRGIQRGDLAPGLSVRAVVEVLTGATLTHVLFGGGARLSAAAEERWVTELVTMLTARA